MPSWYPAFLETITAHLATDREPLLIHWSIGREILHWQQKPDWTSRCLVHLSTDLMARFPAHKGLSVRNLSYMRAFAEAWPHEAYARGPLAALPWYHHLTLLQFLDSPTLRLWYAREALDHDWTRADLKANIAANLYRQAHLRRPAKPNPTRPKRDSDTPEPAAPSCPEPISGDSGVLEKRVVGNEDGETEEE
ncbi:hypothetical protein GCM10009554_17310 [Kribbella koreensis]|uniref:YhcG N-terminal domain-containing protein n=3 Tax=Kribbellaceae TaxID=2726069 RepID=A0ABP6Y6Z9_9ACTN